jgi:hypothetical protein
MKEASNHSVIAPDDKRLLNLLELKVYDITQNVEIISKQLTNNQIKDVFANSYSIFCQMKLIFENAGVHDLYEVIKKMQVNAVLLSTLLAERIDKRTDQLTVKTVSAEVIATVKSMPNEAESQINGKSKSPKLGGICLYN